MVSKKQPARSQYTGPWFNIKMTSYQYRKSHCGDKTILRPSYLHSGTSCTGKMTSLYWIRALAVMVTTLISLTALLSWGQLLPVTILLPWWQWFHVTFVDQMALLNTLRPRQNGCHFADDIFKCIFMNKMFEFWLKCHWSLFLRVQLTIFHHWFR